MSTPKEKKEEKGPTVEDLKKECRLVESELKTSA